MEVVKNEMYVDYRYTLQSMGQKDVQIYWGVEDECVLLMCESVLYKVLDKRVMTYRDVMELIEYKIERTEVYPVIMEWNEEVREVPDYIRDMEEERVYDECEEEGSQGIMY